MLTPWTRTISLTWRPELRFYEERVGLLRDLEDRHALRAFRVADELVDGRLFDGDIELSVRQSGATVRLLTQSAKFDSAWLALEVVLARVRPQRPREFSFTAQHVVPLDLSFEAAVERGYRRLFQVQTVGDIRFGDWALMTDLAGPAGVRDGQIEFGIVRSHEIPRRLAREAGRMGPPIRPSRRPEIRPEGLPDVALFADAMMEGPAEKVGDGFLVAAQGFCAQAESQIGTLVANLHARLIAAESSEEVSE